MSISAERYVFIVRFVKIGWVVRPSGGPGAFLPNDIFYGGQFDRNGTVVS